MIVERMKRTYRLAAVAGMLAMFAGAAVAHATTYTGPVKQILHSSIGWEVNENTANLCLFAPIAEKCRSGGESSKPGLFTYAKGVAVNEDKASPHYGDMYVIDKTARVQELSPSGAFVATFGKEVNTNGGNLCTAAEVAKCKVGREGTAPGQFGEPASITVDPANGDVYVGERYLHGTIEEARVQKFSTTGEFVLEIGKEVNATTKANLCTAAELANCGAAAQAVPETTEHGAFVTPGALAVGGPEDLVYVGDEHRVQEFEADGKFKGEIREPLERISAANESDVIALAIDNSCSLHEPVLTESTTPTCKAFDASYGDSYLVYKVKLALSAAVRKFLVDGEEVKDAHFPVTFSPRPVKTERVGAFGLTSLAVDSADRLAVGLFEEDKESEPPFELHYHPFGASLDGATGHMFANFRVPSPPDFSANALAFNASAELYASQGHEVLSYEPVHITELVTGAVPCVAGAEHETDATLNCELKGEVNPEEVPYTKVWFQWGLTEALGEETTVQEVCSASCGNTKVPVAPVEIKSVRPNQPMYYGLAGNDENVSKASGELLTSEMAHFKTNTVPPRIVGEPSAPFVRSASATLYAKLNPENATTRYEFQYAPAKTCASLEAGCSGVTETASQESSVYGKIETILEVSGLQPATEYRYRLYAGNEKGEGARNKTGGLPLPEGTFTTTPAPVPQATTGVPAPGSITATSATVSGTVNPDGQPATYAFELGVYEGAATQYVVVSSGPSGEGTTFVTKELVLTGLQPGTTYAYRIKVSSGYGTAYGASETFMTAGLPSAPVAPPRLAQLPVPPIAFPVEEAKAKKPTRAQELSRALKACKKKESKKQRTSCERNARKKFGAKPKKKK